MINIPTEGGMGVGTPVVRRAGFHVAAMVCGAAACVQPGRISPSRAACPAPGMKTWNWPVVVESAAVSFRVPPGVTEHTRESGPRSWYLHDDFQQYLLTGFIASSAPVVSLGRAPAPGMLEMTQCVDSVAGREVLVQAWRTRGGTYRNSKRMDRYDVFAVVAVDPLRRFYVASGGYTREMQDLALATVRTIAVAEDRR